MPGQKVHGRSTLVLDWIQTAWYQCAEITFTFCCPIIHPAMLSTLCFLSPLGDLLSIFQNTSNAVLSLMLLPSSACPSLQVPRFDSCSCQIFFFQTLASVADMGNERAGTTRCFICTGCIFGTKSALPTIFSANNPLQIEVWDIQAIFHSACLHACLFARKLHCKSATFQPHPHLIYRRKILTNCTAQNVTNCKQFPNLHVN